MWSVNSQFCLRLLLICISAGTLALVGCEREPAKINISRPPRARPDAIVRFDGDVTGIPDVALTARASRKFVSITNAEPQILDAQGALLPTSYARFTVEGNAYDWFGEYVGVEKRQGRNARRLIWRHPAFSRMEKRLQAGGFRYTEAQFRQALSDFESDD